MEVVVIVKAVLVFAVVVDIEMPSYSVQVSIPEELSYFVLSYFTFSLVLHYFSVIFETTLFGF